MSREVLFQYYPKNSIGCEIGVWQGLFSAQLFAKVSPKKLYLIDPWIVQEYKRRWYSKNHTTQQMMDNLYNHVKHKWEKWPQVKIIRDYSDNALRTIVDNELDWVYIDGNHSEDNVYKDLCNSYGKVRPGGFITGDDFTWIDPDTNTLSVKAAVDRFLISHKGKVRMLNIENGQFILKKD